MSFASLDFLFLLAVTFLGYFLCPPKYRNYVILAASYFFYAYWSVKYLLLLIVIVGIDYTVALRIAASVDQFRRKAWLLVSLSTNIGALVFFKYFNFLSELAAGLTGHAPFVTSVVLPFGISFYTFHAISYVVDVYRGKVPAEPNYVYYSCYVMFFPQLVAGPIARASTLMHQFRETKPLLVQNLIDGAYLMARGYILKLVIADFLSGYVDSQFSDQPDLNSFLVAQAVYFFAFQIYFDFSGYTDIARGVAKLFGFELVINFNRPYCAASITEFWHRWHISLSTWLRDYLYISLGGNRLGRWRTYRNLMITMLLGGLWHGAGVNYAIWGLLHGLYLSIERPFRGSPYSLDRYLPRAVRVFVVFHLVCFAWIFFRCHTFSHALDVIGHCVTWLSHPFTLNGGGIQRNMVAMIVFWLVFEWAEERFTLPARFRVASPWLKLAVGYCAISFIALFAETNPKAFIYFQF